MELKLTIMKGREVLFSGILKANKKAYDDSDGEDEFLEDALNIERYINSQGAYRCHVEDVRE